MAELDYSEYTPDLYEFLKGLGRSNKYIDFSFFNNEAYFDRKSKTFRIIVDDAYEFYRIIDLVNDIKKKDPEVIEVKFFESELNDDEYDSKNEEYNQNAKSEASEKYNVDFETAEHGATLAQYDENNAINKPFINIYSGTEITLHLGEGILDFIYADFRTPLEEAFEDFSESERIIQEEAEASDNSETDETAENSTGEKIYYKTQFTVRDFLKYKFTFEDIRYIAYSSLYSAICPPIFKTSNSQGKDIARYGEYILNLQSFYSRLIEFCYDEDYYPSVLGEMMPVERYSLFRSLLKFPNKSIRAEEFKTGIASLGENNPPYSYELDTMYERFKTPVITDDLIDLAQKYKICARELAKMIAVPRGITIDYHFSKISEILELEFTKMLEENIRFRKCKRCGRYFIMKGNYDTNYCDRLEEGTNRTCKDLAAQENYKKKTEGNEAIALYHKYYKRYAARVKVRQIKEPEFKKWKYEALVKRDECSDGIITPAEYTEWLEGCFPNRKKNN